MSVQRDVKPAFVVQRQEGPFEKKVIKFSKRKIAEGKYETVKEEVIKTIPYGYMVVFPKGHSVFIEDDETLHRLGFSGDAAMVDMETGDVVGTLGIPGLQMPTKQRSGSVVAPKIGSKSQSQEKE